MYFGEATVDVRGETPEKGACPANRGGPRAAFGPEPVQDNEPDAGLGNAGSLGEYPLAVWGYGDDEGQIDGVEALVWQVEAPGVHLP